MATDEESTQPIDIAALRKSLPASGNAPVPTEQEPRTLGALEEGDFSTDEHTAVGVNPLGKRSGQDLLSTNVDPPGPVTDLFALEEQLALGASPASITHYEGPTSQPGTVPAHELVQAMVAHMGALSERLDRTDENETLLPSFALEDSQSGSPDTDQDATRARSRSEPDDDLPTGTSTRLPFPSAWSDAEVTSVSGHQVVPRSAPVSEPPKSEVTNALAVMPLAEPHPADEADDTRMGRLDQAEVRAIFAIAEAGEQTAILRSPLLDEPEAPPPRAPEPIEPESVSDLLDSAELESDPDVASLATTNDDLGDSGVGPSALLAPSPARQPSEPSISGTGSLPRFSLASTSDAPVPSSDPAIVLSSGEQDVQLVSVSSPSVAVPTQQAPETAPADDVIENVDDVVEEVLEDEVSYDDDDGGETLFNRKDATQTKAQAKASPSASASIVPPRKPATMAPPAPPYQPPAPVGRFMGPAYEVDTDEDEDQLQREGSFGALLDLYRLRAADADNPITKAALLHKIASVYELKMNAPEQAFTALVEAFDLRPGDDDIVASLDRVAKAAGRVGELAERARKNLHTADLELKVILLGHLAYWYERVLGRGQELPPLVAELERLDKSHPLALRRQAQLAAAAGDSKNQRELLLRALDRTARRDEKVLLHLALAGAHAGTPEAVKHYEAAVANDHGSVVALQGLERVGREQGKHAQVEWCLERQVEVALTGAERIDALLKLADLYETKFLRREQAAEVLERVVKEEPSHPQALKALERCYHALRAWPQLAKVLRARADNTYDKKQKTELLELAAEVFESKLGDPLSAIDVHRDCLVVDPSHRRALTDLARLYEKMCDWGNMATYKARVAELSTSKRQASQLLVQLGDFLAAPDRDEIAARLQYERAVTVDPTNAAAWEALQRVAAAAGDDRRVAECLEQRARHVDAPRLRAGILVELANVHRGNGADRAAREAFEAAVAADATNEAAAVAMLDVFTLEEKWAKAAPLCDLLVNAAKRDGDMGALFTRLRLSTRISAALGDADRAMTSSLAAIDLHPDAVDAQADLVAVCNQCRTQPKIIGRAKDWLMRLASGPAALPVGVLLALGQIQRSANDIDAAANTLEHALAVEPENPDVLKELADVYLAQGDFARCCKLKVDMARDATSADARFKLLCEAAEIWAKRADELDKAATIYEEARLIKPQDNALLHTLLALYGERHRWDDLSNVLESIAQIQDTPEKKAKSVFAMAQVVLEKVGDPIRAVGLFDRVLDLDRKRLDAFELLVRALTEAKDWAYLERCYRKMIARTKDDPEPNMNLQFALFHQLGLIYRDRLDDAEHAYEALEAAARIRPEDGAIRKTVTELLVVTDNLDTAVSRIRDQIARDPHDAELYAELYELFLRQHFFDKAWCAVNVLVQMREPTDEQRRFHEDYAPMPLAEVPGQIVEQAWRSHVLHADLDPTLTTLFSRMTPAVARMRHAQLRPDQLVYAAGRPFTSAHSRLYEAVRVTFANAAEILHMTPPELLLGDPSSAVPFAPALAPFGAVNVGVPAVEARADALVYVIGKRLAEQRPELIARAFFPAVSDLTALLAAAVRVSRQEGAKDAASAALDASLNAVLLPQERDGIRQVVMQAQHVGGLVDVKRWSQAADLSSTRAGLLLAGDVGPARRVMLAEPQSTADLPPREKIGELYKFATSDLYSDLRGAIGIAVQS